MCIWWSLLVIIRKYIWLLCNRLEDLAWEDVTVIQIYGVCVFSLRITSFFFRKKALYYQYHLWRGILVFFSRIISVAATLCVIRVQKFWISAPSWACPSPINLVSDAALFIWCRGQTNVFHLRFAANKTLSFPLQASRDTCALVPARRGRRWNHFWRRKRLERDSRGQPAWHWRPSE